MGSWRRMGAFLGLVPEDEARDEGDYYDDDFDRDGYGETDNDFSDARSDYRSSYETRRSRYRGQDDASRGGSRSAYSEPVVHGALAVQMQPEYQRSAESATASRPMTVKLTGFGEARIIGERYRDGASVILDMTDLTDSEARRVVDFAAGLAFAMRGSIDKVTARVFMLLPPDVDMSAEDRRAFAGTYASR